MYMERLDNKELHIFSKIIILHNLRKQLGGSQGKNPLIQKIPLLSEAQIQSGGATVKEDAEFSWTLENLFLAQSLVAHGENINSSRLCKL